MNRTSLSILIVAGHALGGSGTALADPSSNAGSLNHPSDRHEVAHERHAERPDARQSRHESRHDNRSERHETRHDNRSERHGQRHETRSNRRDSGGGRSGRG